MAKFYVNFYENERFQELTDLHMKGVGKSDTVRGELIRAVNRIGYRYLNDGDFIGVGYGNETCNAAGRYIFKHGNKEMADILSSMWNGEVNDSDTEMADSAYEILLSALVEETVKYADSTDSKLDEETEDMFDYSDKFDMLYDVDEEDW